MIVNGVTLPDIPAEVLASYPNAMITLAKNNTLGTETYAFWASSTEFIYLSQEAFPEAENTLSSLNDFMSAAYDEDESAWKDESVIPAGTNLLLTVNAGLTTLDIIWSNHDIYEVASVNEETGEFTYGDIYFANSEESKPDRVSIGRSLVDGYAREVQRLTGTTEQMNAIQIREKLSTVNAAIKIGNTVLPPIPEDVLAEYPYATILGITSPEWTHNNTLYHLLVSVSKLNHFAGSLVGLEYEEMLGNFGTGKILWTYANAEYPGWTVGDEIPAGSFAKPVGTVYEETAVPLWANHDIYEVIAVDMNTGAVTTGDLYFSERQNFNGVWLPKVPADVLAEYPYAVIIRHDYGTGVKYSLRVTSNHWRYIGRELLESVMGSGVLGTADGVIESLDEPFMVVYNCSVNASAWSDGVNNNDVMFPVGTNQADTVTPIWSNQDIYIATGIDVNTGTVILGTDVYFPPLPTIDTDRVSIGYDLCDGIVEEVQRLSGDQEKMDALHAYWKLTTVSALVTAPGEIIINGVKLPPIPAELLAEQPYAVILHDPEDANPDEYTLYTTKGEIGYLPPSITGSSYYGALVSSEVGHTLYLATPNSTEWTLSKQYDSNYLCGIVPSFRPDWANLDIYEITSLDASTGAYTKGDIWFAKTV